MTLDPKSFYERSDHYIFAKNGVPSVLSSMESMLITIKKPHQILNIEYDA
jgi:hypothetical protein